MSSVSNPSKILVKISMPRQNTNDKILIKSRRHVVGIILVKLKRGQNQIWSKHLEKLISIYHLHLSPAYTTPPHLHNNNTTFTDTQHLHIHRNPTPPPPTLTLLHPTPTPPHRQDRRPHHRCPVVVPTRPTKQPGMWCLLCLCLWFNCLVNFCLCFVQYSTHHRLPLLLSDHRCHQPHCCRTTAATNRPPTSIKVFLFFFTLCLFSL